MGIKMAATKNIQEKADPKATAEQGDDKSLKKRKHSKPMESSTLYKSSVKRLVRERLKDNYTISSASVTILASIAFDFFQTIGTSAGHLAKSVNKQTLGAAEIKGAVRLELGGKELSNNIIVDIDTAM